MRTALALIFLIVSNSVAIKNRDFESSDDYDEDEGSYSSLSMAQMSSNMQTQAID